ncbi:hypothetical protein LXL04_013126 [Taraxacum kok-saghyz]
MEAWSGRCRQEQPSGRMEADGLELEIRRVVAGIGTKLEPLEPKLEIAGFWEEEAVQRCGHVRVVSLGHESCPGYQQQKKGTIRRRPSWSANIYTPLSTKRAVQMRTIIGGGNGGTNLGHLFQFVADQFSDAGALLSAQHIENIYYKIHIKETHERYQIRMDSLQLNHSQLAGGYGHDLAWKMARWHPSTPDLGMEHRPP